LIEGSVEKSQLAPLLLGVSQPGGLNYHRMQLEHTGKFPVLSLVFIVNVVNCFAVYFHYFAPHYATWYTAHVVGLISAILSITFYTLASRMDPG